MPRRTSAELMDELRKSEEKFRTVFERSGDGILVANARTKRFVLANSKACELTGYSARELLELGAKDIHPKKDLPYVLGCFMKQLQGKLDVAKDIPVLRKDGKVVYCDINSAHAKIGGMDVLMGFFRDITERKKAEEELKESERKRREAQEFGRIGNWEFELSSGKITWSDEVYRLYERDKSSGPPSAEEEARYYPPEEARRLHEFARLAAKTGREFKYDLTAKLPSGKTAYFTASMHPVKDEKGRVSKLFGTVQDITERKKVEEELRKAEERFHIAAETSNDVVYEWDMRHSLQWFGKIDKMLGYGPGKFPRTLDAWTDSIHPEDRKRVMAALQAHLDGRVPYAIEYRVQRKDGTYRWWAARGAVTRTPDGHPVRWVGTVTDITERKKAETKLKDSEEKWISLTGNTNDIIMMVDNKGVIRYINKTIPPYTPEGTIGKSLYEYTQTEQHDIMRKSLGRVFKTGEPDSYEISSEIPKIGIVWFNTKMVPVKRDGSVDSVIMISTDITERKKAEEKIKVFSDAVASAFDYFLLTDTKGNITYANESAIRAFGYTSEEFLRLNIDKIDPDPEASKKVMQELQVKGKWSGEVMNIRKNKEKFPSVLSAFIIKDKEGNSKGMMGILRDITERKKAEEDLRKNEIKYKTLVENIPQKIFVKNRTLVYLSCNDNYARDLKIKPEEIEGKTDYDFYPKELAEKYRADDKSVVERGEVVDIEEKYIQDGKEFFVHTIKTPVRDERGNVIGILGIFWDITERKKAEEDIKKKTEELEKSKKELEGKVKELERFSRLSVGRELRMIELKKGVKELEEKSKGK